MSIAAERQVFIDSLGVAASQFLSLFDLMPDVSFFLKDRRGRFMALNMKGCAYCGVRTERDAFGKTDRDFFPRGRAQEYMADDRRVMESGTAIVNRLEPAPESDLSPHWVITNKMPVRDAQGTVIGVMGFSRSVEQVRFAPGSLQRLSSVVEIMHRHYADELSTADLAEQAGLSISQFERTFRKTFGIGPKQYIVRVRLEHACRMLAESVESIASSRSAVASSITRT